ncbi:MAG: CvpA family protein [Candidatus Endonucleobacter sp. (ex Gigantidas childressi)]|nr:CvpA family protein [Candidatus Endonucleobacter sp. (ex Gigantidas childressi)]
MTGFNWIDGAILGIVLVSALISLMRGFVKEVLSLITWSMAAVLIWAFGDDFAVYFNDYIANHTTRLMVACVVLLVATLIVGGAINRVIVKFIGAAGWSIPDRLAGMLFGGMRGCLIIVSLTGLMKIIPLEENMDLKSSVLLPTFLVLADWSRQKTAVITNFLLSEGKGFIESVRQ